MHIGIMSRSQTIWATSRLLESAEQLGHFAHYISTTHVRIGWDENGVPIASCDGENLSELDVIIPRIGGAMWLMGSRILRHFELMRIPCTLSAQALEFGRDKFKTLQILNENGIAIPRTELIQSTTDASEIINSFESPFVLKFIDGTQGVGCIKSDEVKHAVEVAEAFTARGVPLMVQEYIETSGKDRRFLVLGKRVAAAMERNAAKGEWRANYHRGASVHLLNPTKQDVRFAVNAARSIGAEISGVDMLHTPDKDYVIEVNTSPGFSGLEMAHGKDIGKRIIKHAVEIATAK